MYAMWPCDTKIYRNGNCRRWTGRLLSLSKPGCWVFFFLPLLSLMPVFDLSKYPSGFFSPLVHRLPTGEILGLKCPWRESGKPGESVTVVAATEATSQCWRERSLSNLLTFDLFERPLFFSLCLWGIKKKKRVPTSCQTGTPSSTVWLSHVFLPHLNVFLPSFSKELWGGTRKLLMESK